MTLSSRGFQFKVLLLQALLLQTAWVPGAHATQAGANLPAAPKDPGAAETQIFWQQRNRDHLILQQRTLSNQIMIYENLESSGDSTKLRSELGAFCSGSENAGSCLSRYKRAAARQLEDIKGALLRSEDEITRLRSDLPGQGGVAVERGGVISGSDDNPESKKNQTNFSAKSKNPTELLGPAYVPTLEELDTRARDYRSKQSGYTSNEHRYQNWAQSTFAKPDANTHQSLDENYALFQAVKPTNPSPGGEAPLRRIQTQGNGSGAKGMLVDQQKKEAAIKSLEANAPSDLARAHEAKQRAIDELERREEREKNPNVKIQDKYTQSEIDALNLARGEIIQAYTDKLAETKLPTAKPSQPSAAPSGKTAQTPAVEGGKTESSTTGTATARRRVAGAPPVPQEVHTQVTGKTKPSSGGPPVSDYANTPYYNDRPVEGQLLEPKDYHIYMDPAGIDEQILDLRGDSPQSE